MKLDDYEKQERREAWTEALLASIAGIAAFGIMLFVIFVVYQFLS